MTAEATSDQTFAAVETTTTRDDALNMAFADTIEYGIKSAPVMHEDITKGRATSCRDGFVNGSASIFRQVWLPTEHEALALFEEYIASTGTVYHILHFPTTRQLIKDIYARLSRHQKVGPAHLALLLSVAATGAYFWSPAISMQGRLFQSSSQAEDCSNFWMKWAMDVLENNRRTIFPSVEDLQATILICHLITNLEGFGARARFLYSTGLNMARDMGLHIIDSPRNRKKPGSEEGHIAIEVKRRLWWYIASSDWYVRTLSLFSPQPSSWRSRPLTCPHRLMCNIPGPQEGFYSCQPSQCCVNMPLNISDEALTDISPPVGLPLSVPTQMSYFILRCTAGDLARLIVDAQPPPSSSSTLISSADFTALQNIASETFNRLPAYFRLDKQHEPEVMALHKADPYLTMQRAIVNLGVYLGTIRLHRPYLFRRDLAHPYTRSRETCLHAARQIIAIRKSMNEIHSTLGFSRGKITFIVHHVFMAVLVLAFDLCFNGAVLDSEEEGLEGRKKEVREACEMLEVEGGGAEQGMGVAERYLRPLRETLSRHRVLLGEKEKDKERDKVGAGTATKKDQGIVPGFADQESGTSMAKHADADLGFDASAVNSSAGGTYLPWDSGQTNTITTSAGDYMNGSMDTADDASFLWNDILEFPMTFETTPDWDQVFADLDATCTF